MFVIRLSGRRTPHQDLEGPLIEITQPSISNRWATGGPPLVLISHPSGMTPDEERFCTEDRLHLYPVPKLGGGQTFPKSTEIRNSVAFRAFFSVFFRPFLSVVADSVSEQLLQRTDGLGGQFWLSKESVSTSATDCRISAPICTKYGLQKSVLVSLMDCISYVKYLANTYIQSRKAESIF